MSNVSIDSPSAMAFYPDYGEKLWSKHDYKYVVFSSSFFHNDYK